MKSKMIFLGILLTSLLVLGSILNKTQTLEQEESLENVELAIYLEEEKASQMPSPSDGYEFEKAVCYVEGEETDEVSVTWDKDAWAPQIYGLEQHRTYCNLYFKQISFRDAFIECGLSGKDAATCFKENYLNPTSELIDDQTEDNNIRYVGKDPNNYVSFGNGVWRIIGVMNNMENSSNVSGSYIKIVDDSVDNYSTWNDDLENPWNTSNVQTLLNNTIYETLNKEYIETMSWPFNFVSSSASSYSAKDFYGAERSNKTNYWVGNVGLIYPSDYGFASVGSENVETNSCHTSSLSNYSSISDCVDNNWLYLNSTYWMMLAGPQYSSDSMERSYSFHTDGNVNSFSAGAYRGVLPAVYLKSSVKILSGSGTKTDPYILSL